MTYGVASPAAREAYEATQRALFDQTLTCRYCKAAKTRALSLITEVVYSNVHTRLRAVERANQSMCSKHRDRSRLNYVCSPVSETYWTS